MSPTSSKTTAVVPLERVERAILVIRGHRVVLDETLAQLYGVPIKRLNEQVRRNNERFPDDFMFQLSSDEWDSLRSQIATLKHGRGQHRKYLPYAFTEHGAVMAANVLNSPTAVQASIQVVRAFVRLRQMLASHEELARKLEALERKYDQSFKVVFDTIRALMTPAEPKRRTIGFVANRPGSQSK
jgi:phage regulator Rha-like protein